MQKAVLYIHGKGGSAAEAERYRPLLPGFDVIGLDYKAGTPWEAKEEFPQLFDAASRNSEAVLLVCNSIGAYFAMSALQNRNIERAFFISPIVDMEKLITDMMTWANVTEGELRQKREIETAFGETLSWDYLCYVRQHPITWSVPTDILYGEMDNMTSCETMTAFAQRTNATLTVMKGGEHWFHTVEQLAFLDGWLKGLL